MTAGTIIDIIEVNSGHEVAISVGRSTNNVREVQAHISEHLYLASLLQLEDNFTSELRLLNTLDHESIRTSCFRDEVIQEIHQLSRSDDTLAILMQLADHQVPQAAVNLVDEGVHRELRPKGSADLTEGMHHGIGLNVCRNEQTRS